MSALYNHYYFSVERPTYEEYRRNADINAAWQWHEEQQAQLLLCTPVEDNVFVVEGVNLEDMPIDTVNDLLLSNHI